MYCKIIDFNVMQHVAKEKIISQGYYVTDLFIIVTYLKSLNLINVTNKFDN